MVDLGLEKKWVEILGIRKKMSKKILGISKKWVEILGIRKNGLKY